MGSLTLKNSILKSNHTIFVVLFLIPTCAFSQKHTLELGYFPYAYYDDHYDIGWHGGYDLRNSDIILRYTYHINDRWSVSGSKFLLRGPEQNQIEGPGNKNRYLSSTMRHAVVEVSYTPLRIRRIHLSVAAGASHRNRSTGLGTWVGPPFNAAGNTYDKKSTIGLKLGSNIRLQLPHDFSLNYNFGYFRQADDQAEGTLIMHATIGVSF